MKVKTWLQQISEDFQLHGMHILVSRLKHLQIIRRMVKEYELSYIYKDWQFHDFVLRQMDVFVI
jgi:hypothetical protein